MSFLVFQDSELGILLSTINKMQICFHSIYAPEGVFSVENIFNLKESSKNNIIIADKNLVSPIRDIAIYGTLNNKTQLQEIAKFVIWSIYINAEITCGMGLIENDTSNLSNFNGDEYKEHFLHAINNIPLFIWKELAFGYRDTVPEEYLYNGKVIKKSSKYTFKDNFLYLCNEAAIAKIVTLIRKENMEAIDKFICFMNWYTDYFDIAESIVVYAAMVFANIPNVSLPKKSKTNSFQKIKKGIKNQAWDMTYITYWSTLYFKEDSNCYMFATNDITLKLILINILPPGMVDNTISYIFSTKIQQQKLYKLIKEKFGANRIKPFKNISEKDRLAIVKKILEEEYKNIRKTCKAK